MALDPEQHRLSPADHQYIFDTDIKPRLFAGAKTSDQPVAIVFGGQPGAGKSSAVDAAIRELVPRGGAVQILGDELRDFHPHYRRLMKQDDQTAAFYTDRDAGKWVEMAIAYAKEQRVNIVIEGTMRNSDKVAETMASLRSVGYEIDARALAVNERFSQQGILQRYEAQKADRGVGRMTIPEAHQAAYDGLPSTLARIEQEKLADRVTVYRRGAAAIYTNELKGGEWAHPIGARAALEAERNRPMTLQEHRNYVEGFSKLADMLTKPERQASAVAIKNMDYLHKRAAMALAVESLRQKEPGAVVQQAAPGKQHDQERQR